MTKFCEFGRGLRKLSVVVVPDYATQKLVGSPHQLLGER